MPENSDFPISSNQISTTSLGDSQIRKSKRISNKINSYNPSSISSSFEFQTPESEDSHINDTEEFSLNTSSYISPKPYNIFELLNFERGLLKNSYLITLNNESFISMISYSSLGDVYEYFSFNNDLSGVLMVNETLSLKHTKGIDFPKILNQPKKNDNFIISNNCNLSETLLKAGLNNLVFSQGTYTLLFYW
ncbi:hypothetical protein AYI70_g11213 [Smittium culicis]|uniref:Uncharacterized protein n=1 Tax=Smittium culicis TaxID=133412 RepID=A0A1R1X2X2_9FUNG|nr:hypothetical protein AYI70_g11213 [Smittium culicis]